MNHRSTMRYLVAFGACLVLAAALHAQSSPQPGETLEECVARKIEEQQDLKTQEVIHDTGCTTGSTDTWGKSKHCGSSVCWTVPPGRVIVSAHAVEHSGNGSQHDFSGPSYNPDRERALSVCFGVSAKSRGGMSHSGERGWEKLDVTVTHKRVFSQAEVVALARACQEGGAR